MAKVAKKEAFDIKAACAELAIIYEQEQTLKARKKDLADQVIAYAEKHSKTLFADKKSNDEFGVTLKEKSVRKVVTDKSVFSWEVLGKKFPNFIKNAFDETAIKNFAAKDAFCAAQIAELGLGIETTVEYGVEK